MFEFSFLNFNECEVYCVLKRKIDQIMINTVLIQILPKRNMTIFKTAPAEIGQDLFRDSVENELLNSGHHRRTR